MNQKDIDQYFMHRCIELALNGQKGARPNPMVGCVIVAQNKIIGEGFHKKYGEAHAEVNAFESIPSEFEYLLPQATVYVSLEPCAHYGHTPPCADLIISKNVKRVVVGCKDPFSKVSGRGIERIQNAGIDVVVGVLEKECLFLNRYFITSNTLHRPYIILKWAETADGFIDCNKKAMAISTPFTSMLVHKLRSEVDAILVGNTTQQKECPQLNVRHWSGESPIKVVLSKNNSLENIIEQLNKQNVQSLLVEGGLKTHNSFLSNSLWDEIHVERSPILAHCGTPAPQLPKNISLVEHNVWDNNECFTFIKQQ